MPRRLLSWTRSSHSSSTIARSPIVLALFAALVACGPIEPDDDGSGDRAAEDAGPTDRSSGDGAPDDGTPDDDGSGDETLDDEGSGDGTPDEGPDPSDDEPGGTAGEDEAERGPEDGPADWPLEWAILEMEVVDEVNAFRAAGATCADEAKPPVPPLAMQAQLRHASRLHAQDMGDQGYFDHDSLDGREPWDRFREAGYSGGAMGENIAAGRSTAEAVVDGWMASPGHCRNIMNPAFGVIGVGYAFVPGSPYGHYWVQGFGDR